jgi:hypothetical protein
VSIAPVKSTKAKGKERAFKRTVIDVPRGNHDSEDSELGDDDLDAFEEFGAGASFLQSLDEKGISRCVFPPTAMATVTHVLYLYQEQVGAGPFTSLRQASAPGPK